MEGRKKRKAKDQLSPYSTEEEELSRSTVEEATFNGRKKSKVRGSPAIVNSESLKGVLSSVNILKPVVKNDKISGLNRCFLRALQTVVETESNKNLSYLFRQYEKYYEELTNGGD